MNKKYTSALKPYGDHIIAMYALVRESTDDELAVLREACSAVTTTNCGWYEYQVAQAINRDVESEIYQRSQAGKEESKS